MHLFDNFRTTDYSETTGRLNIYGMKKFTEHMCEYIQKNYPYTPSPQTKASIASWQEDIAAIHEQANQNNMTIDPGKLYKAYNEEDGIRLLWNHYPDASEYSVQRSKSGCNDFSEIATTTEPIYLDKNVEPKQVYTYRIVPMFGDTAGSHANELEYAFVDAPQQVNATAESTKPTLNWIGSSSASYYQVQRKKRSAINYERIGETNTSTFSDSDSVAGTAYDYLVQAVYTVGDDHFYSSSVLVSFLPVAAPQITSISATESNNAICWEEYQEDGIIEIYRRSASETEFLLCNTVETNICHYEDSNVEPGMEYFYKLVMTQSSYGVNGNSDHSNTVGIIAK